MYFFKVNELITTPALQLIQNPFYFLLMADLFAQLQEEVVLHKTDSGFDDDFLDVKNKAKDLLPQINWVITQRKIDYIEKLILLRNHSSIQIRRKVATGLGFLATKANIEDLQKWQLAESDRQTWLILESTIDKLQRGIDGYNTEKSVKILSVSEALSVVKNLLGQGTYVIEGEIAEVRPVRQMYYFGVKDKQDSRIDCMSFVGVVLKAGFPLNDGLTVRVTGKFKLSKSSRIYFDIEKLELTGEGELLRNLKLLEEKLTREGLFDEARKRPIPVLPKNILLLASSSSAALTDFQKVLGERRKGINIYHLPIKTQGVGAEYEILTRLELVNEFTEQYDIDTVVLTRGGGSNDDLVVFNSEKVVRALHGINRPTIVAIGHERDTTLAELVADLRASTPSNAAELASLSNDQVFRQLDSYKVYFSHYFKQRQRNYMEVTDQLTKYMANYCLKQIQTNKIVCEKTGQLVTSFIGRTKLETERLWHKTIMGVKMETNQILFKLESMKNFSTYVATDIMSMKNEVASLKLGIYREIQENFNVIRNQFQLVSSQILLQDPKNILEKGYAIIKQDQKVVEKISDLKTGEITIQLQDGQKTLPNLS